MTTPSLVWLVVSLNMYPSEKFGPYSDVHHCNKVRDTVQELIKHKLTLYRDYFYSLECR